MNDTTDSSALMNHLSSLDNSISDLQSALQPLLTSDLHQTTSKLPLLDKAKLYTLLTYTLGSLIFSTLRLQGVDAKEHPVFVELTRCRQYFEKIAQAEGRNEGKAGDGGVKNAVLDKGAAERFIKHGLSGNDTFDKERAAKLASEKVRLQAKLDALGPQRYGEDEQSSKRKATEDIDGPADDEAAHSAKKRHRTKEEKEERRARKDAKSRVKSSKPPKSSKDIFKDLVKKSEKEQG